MHASMHDGAFIRTWGPGKRLGKHCPCSPRRLSWQWLYSLILGFASYLLSKTSVKNKGIYPWTPWQKPRREQLALGIGWNGEKIQGVYTPSHLLVRARLSHSFPPLNWQVLRIFKVINPSSDPEFVNWIQEIRRCQVCLLKQSLFSDYLEF